MTLTNKKHGFVALVGAPNAGKSTLTNTLLGQKLSITSPKIQTTRNSIKAIIVEKEKQLILIDTPGIFIPKEDKILERLIVKSAWQGLRQANHICFLIDATTGLNPQNYNILQDLLKETPNITVIITKIDLIKKPKILEIIAKLSQLSITEIFPVSSTTKDGIDKIKNYLLQKCQNLNWPYDENEITDAPTKFLACEITREKLFEHLNQELPYSLTVKTDDFQILDNGQIKIHQSIYVLKESQKKIILGKNGQRIKQISIKAKEDISNLVNHKIHLYLFIKVKSNWMNNIDSFEKIDNPQLIK